jgi:hypothetical protein
MLDDAGDLAQSAPDADILNGDDVSVLHGIFLY